MLPALRLPSGRKRTAGQTDPGPQRRPSRLLTLEICVIALISICLILALCMPARSDSGKFPSVAAAAAGKLVHGAIRGVAPRGGFIAADVPPAEAIALSHRRGRGRGFTWGSSTIRGNTTGASLFGDSGD